MARWWIAAALMAFVGCSDGDNNAESPDMADVLTADAGDAGLADTNSPDAGADAPDMAPDPLAAGEAGAHEVGNVTLSLTDGARSRALDVEVWYPASESGTESILEFEVEPHRTTLADLMAASNDCPNAETGSARNAAAVAGTHPLVVFSHCHACTRYSSFSIAEHLASWGYIVVAPDHEDNTLFDELAGTGAALGADFLAVRAADIQFVLDEVIDNGALPDGLAVDVERVGAMGHSFGSVTTGLVAQTDDRVSAAMGLAAPMENPLLPGVSVAEIDVPLMFLLAAEDNSIREIGNRLIRDNFSKAADAWKLEVAEAGHWSVSDLVGLVEMFEAGCGDGTRQVGGDPFTYIDPALGRQIAAAYALAFFETTLAGNEAAAQFLAQPPPWADVTVERSP